MPLKLYSRPRDRSPQAFKDWVQSTAYPLHPRAKRTVATRDWIDEAGWADNWKKFWARLDQALKSSKPDEG